MGSKLLASANAPAFTGNITIVLTDGVTTVSQVIAIDRRPTTVSVLVTQTLDLISVAGSIDSLSSFDIPVQSIVSEVGFNNSFSLLSMSVLLSVTGADDGFTLGDSVVADNVTANGVSFSYAFTNASSQPVATLNIAYIISVSRVFEDSPETSYDAIGCDAESAASFRASLLNAVRVKFNSTAITFASCAVSMPDTQLIIKYRYYTNNGTGGSGGG